ncbi:hypothetical protein [Roseobacter sinensis]|uniref:Transposase n=1 Tax=Roseobacter sinensis TaxID=2931391 RepID=A0ABT3B8P4_9RHOB|nr:hypothetical protein [Roseobacter sp. WL0113]MCV3269799.1 hypothetical protein [Roseobacter sp. WL0113]
MKRRGDKATDPARVTPSASTVRTILTWLVEADREFRVAQSMVEKFHRRF